MSNLNKTALMIKWNRLAQREQHLLKGLAVFLLITLLYTSIWAPIHKEHSQQQAALSKAQADWQWLTEQAPKVSKQGVKRNLLQIHSKTELMNVLQKSLQQQKLLKSVQGLNLSNRGVTVSFTQVDAPRLFRWLSGLEKRGLKSKRFDLTPIKAGLTQASIDFEVVK